MKNKTITGTLVTPKSVSMTWETSRSWISAMVFKVCSSAVEKVFLGIQQNNR